jgi:hypothetical protein
VSSKLKGQNEPIQPNQAMVMFMAADGSGRKDWSSVVKVRKGGKGKWELVRHHCRGLSAGGLMGL